MGNHSRILQLFGVFVENLGEERPEPPIGGSGKIDNAYEYFFKLDIAFFTWDTMFLFDEESNGLRSGIMLESL